MSGLRERKKAETRAALGWAAVRLAAERGYDAVRVEDIAAAAGVSPRTFNNYFSSKAEAIASRHLHRMLQASEELRLRPAGEPLWTAITAAVLAAFVPGPEVEEQPRIDVEGWGAGVAAMVAEPAVQGELLRAEAAAEQALAAAIAERTGTDPQQDMYPNLVAGAVGAAVAVAMQHSLRTDPPPRMHHLLTEALAQMAAGLPIP